MSSTTYIGMDVHKESISIQVMNSVGKAVMECCDRTGRVGTGTGLLGDQLGIAEFT